MSPSEKQHPKSNLNLDWMFSSWYNFRSSDFTFQNLSAFVSCCYGNFFYQIIVLISNFNICMHIPHIILQNSYWPQLSLLSNEKKDNIDLSRHLWAESHTPHNSSFTTEICDHWQEKISNYPLMWPQNKYPSAEGEMAAFQAKPDSGSATKKN